MSSHIYVAAVEDSADAIGADVARNLRLQQSDIILSGVGGAQMKNGGIASAIDTSGLAVLGLFDGIKAFSRVKRIVASIADEIEARDPDAVVLIDSWGVMWRLARELKRRNLRAVSIKLIGPQVWATRPGRARVLAKWCDHLLCIHDFEQRYYRTAGLPTTVIGNPAIGRLPKGDADRFREQHGISYGTSIIGLLPGSRIAELKRVAPALLQSVSRLKKIFPDATVLCLPAPSIRTKITRCATTWPFTHMIADADQDRSDAMAAMDIALACSGTVTTELAEQGVAVITGYKLGWTSWAVARLFLLRTRFISLINIAAGREIIPEFVQTRLTPKRVTQAAYELLENHELRRTQIHAQTEVVRRLAGTGEGTSAKRAAAKILDLVQQVERVP